MQCLCLHHEKIPCSGLAMGPSNKTASVSNAFVNQPMRLSKSAKVVLDSFQLNMDREAVRGSFLLTRCLPSMLSCSASRRVPTFSGFLTSVSLNSLVCERHS